MDDLCAHFCISSKMTKDKIAELAHFPVSSCKFLACFRECIMADKPLSTQHQGNKHNHGFMRDILVHISNMSQAFPLLRSAPCGAWQVWYTLTLDSLYGCYHCSLVHNCAGSKPTIHSRWWSSWGLWIRAQPSRLRENWICPKRDEVQQNYQVDASLLIASPVYFLLFCSFFFQDPFTDLPPWGLAQQSVSQLIKNFYPGRHPNQ